MEAFDGCVLLGIIVDVDIVNVLAEFCLRKEETVGLWKWEDVDIALQNGEGEMAVVLTGVKLLDMTLCSSSRGH